MFLQSALRVPFTLQHDPLSFLLGTVCIANAAAVVQGVLFDNWLGRVRTVCSLVWSSKDKDALKRKGDITTLVVITYSCIVDMPINPIIS